MTSETTDISLIKIFSDGTGCILKRITYCVAYNSCFMCFRPFPRMASPLIVVTPSSIIFFALSQAPPALDWKIAISTPHTVTPASSPPNVSGSKCEPNNYRRNDTAKIPGKHHFFNGRLSRDFYATAMVCFCLTLIR